jgi:hypothetical protein
VLWVQNALNRIRIADAMEAELDAQRSASLAANEDKKLGMSRSTGVLNFLPSEPSVQVPSDSCLSPPPPSSSPSAHFARAQYSLSPRLWRGSQFSHYISSLARCLSQLANLAPRLRVLSLINVQASNEDLRCLSQVFVWCLC